MESYWDECLALPSKLKDWDAYNDMKSSIQFYRDIFTLLCSLASKVHYNNMLLLIYIILARFKGIMDHCNILNSLSSSSSAFSLFGVGASSFQSPRSLVLCFSYLYFFLLHVFSYNITPPQFWSSYLSMSTHFHVLITTCSSVILSNSLTISVSLLLLSYLCLPHLPLL